MTCKYTDHMEVNALSIKGRISAVENLANTLAPSFGPCGNQALISTSCGSCIVTKAGRTILESCFMQHPVMKWIKEWVTCHQQTSGDNCKSFVLLLLEVFRRITTHHSHAGATNLNTVSGLSIEKFCQEICPNFTHLARCILPQTVLSLIIKSDVCISVPVEDSDAFWEIIKKLICSNLHGNLSQNCAMLLGKLTVEFVQSGSCQSKKLEENLHFILKNFSLLCQEIGGFPVSESHIIDGVLISRDFLYYDSSLHLTEDAVIVALVTCEFCTDHKVANFHISLSNMDHVEAVVTSNERKWTSFVAQLQILDVKVLLSVEIVPEPLLALCRQAGISVIHSIFMEELTHISDRIGVPLLYELNDLHIPTIRVNFCKRVILGKEALTNIGFISKDGVTLKHLVVCGPTISICRTYSVAIQDSLRNLHVCLKGEKEFATITATSQRDLGEQHLHVVHGGGAVELTASDALKKWAEHSRDDKLSFVSLCFAEALEIIPRMLHNNSYKADGKRFLEGKLNKVEDVNTCRGINARTGCWQPSCELGVIESLVGKLLLWQNVLDAFCDLVRLDAVVGVETCKAVDQDVS